MARYLGAHTVFNGGISMAALRAGNAGMKALQIFTAPPQYYGDKATMRPDRVQRFHAALETAGIALEHVVVHGAYVLNTATEDETKSARARAGLRKELERATALGVAGVCFHPGAAISSERRPATRRVAGAITEALEHVPGKTRVWVENTAGAGTTIGRTAEEIGCILEAVPARLRPRTGYGLDTCHLFSSGHDIAKSAAEFKRVLDEFQSVTGEPPSFFHLNDSEGALGSNKDRHVLIGTGKIGREPFRWLLEDQRTKNIPLILETPEQNYDIAEDDPSADPYDVAMMELLTSMMPRD
ncbi:MAG TPA: deoxyribonuclease IV [Gemmatimonadales bacterium]|jgi:deoxyribonuclease-4|nr:deoxyribonuclease IV [Gemmatimonadales bacterium]